MPRLIGKQSNPAIPLSLFLLAAIAIVTALEYVGAINIINGFGHDARNESPERHWQR